MDPARRPTRGGPDTGSHRVLRGGSWGSNNTNNVRVTFRNIGEPGSRDIFNGFRVVRRPG
jgi:formylglycine-generating enzyme required for sulfatase activity